MNIEELKAVLQAIVDGRNEVGLSVYAVLKDQGDALPCKLDIEASSVDGLIDLFFGSLMELIGSTDLSILNLSTSDERLNAIYRYDLEVPAELELMEGVLGSDNLPLLDLETKNLSAIKALLIEIGNNDSQLVLYKTMAPINIFGRSNFFLKKSRHRLEQIDDEFLRVSSNFQMMRVKDELLVIDLESLERTFGFGDVIKREAALGVASVEQLKLIHNPETLHELLDDVKYARRLTKVAKASPVLKAGIDNAKIIEFCKIFPVLAGRIRFNDAGDKIVLDTKVSKDLFIKLLMDNFLTSELTSFHYESVAKDSVEVAVENG